MKISFWDVLTGILMFAGFGVVLVFANIFIDPYTILNPFPPPTLQPTIKVPTLTPTLRKLPAIWTATPTGNVQTTTLLPSLTPVASKTGFTLAPTNTKTPIPSLTPAGTNTPTRTNTPLGGKTSTPTRTRTPTRTNTTSSFAVTSVRNIAASPSSWNAVCPYSFSLTADIVSNRSGTVTFYWVKSGGGSGNTPTQTIEFTAAGTISISTPITGNSSNTTTYSLYIDNPNHQQFGGISVVVNCSGLSFTSPANISRPENDPTITTVTTNIGGSTFSIIPGVDAAWFNITSGGILTFVPAPNFESPTDTGPNNVYNVNVHAVNGSYTADQAIAVTVTDVNEFSPAITGGATASTSVPENTPISTTVIDVNATDADTSQTITYSISGGDDAGDFNINSSTGVLTFKEVPNYELPSDNNLDKIYEVIVQASDNGSPVQSTTQSITVTVTNVNDAPVLSGGSATISIAENTATSTILADFSVTDEDVPGQTLTFSIVAGGDSGMFSVDGTTGELSFASIPDYENPVGGDNTYNITVQVEDNGAPVESDTQAVEVTVTNLDEAPTVTKAFGPNPITVTTGISTMTITIANISGNAVGLTGVAFTDTFPAGMEVAAVPNESTTDCGTPTFTPLATNTSLTFSGGTIAIGASCVVEVDVIGTTTGAKDNSTSVVTSTEADNGAAANATLNVDP